MESKESAVMKGGFHGREGGQAKETCLGEVAKSVKRYVDANLLQENLESLGFTSSVAKPEIEKGVGRRRVACKKTGRNESG